MVKFGAPEEVDMSEKLEKQFAKESRRALKSGRATVRPITPSVNEEVQNYLKKYDRVKNIVEREFPPLSQEEQIIFIMVCLTLFKENYPHDFVEFINELPNTFDDSED